MTIKIAILAILSGGLAASGTILIILCHPWLVIGAVSLGLSWYIFRDFLVEGDPP